MTCTPFLRRFSKLSQHLLATFLLATPALAAPDIWTPLGPDGGEALEILASPTEPGVLYAGMSGGGVFVTRDGGASWQPAASGLVSSWVGALAMSQGGTLYAGTNRGVFELAPAAAAWRRISDGLPEVQYIGGLAIDPSDSRVLYAMVTRGVFSGSWALYRSRDGGASWAEAGEPFLTFNRPLAILPTDPPTLLASAGVGVRRSQDGGDTWQSSAQGLPQFLYFSDILVDPSSPSTVFVAVRDFSLHEALPYKSTDGGQTWALAAQGIPPAEFSFEGRLAADPARPGVLVWGDARGVFRSTDGAGSWQPVNPAPANREVLDLQISGDGSIFAGVTSFADGALGVLRSTDDGASWQAQDAGLSATSVQTLHQDLEAPDRWLASTITRGLSSSEDDGQTWRRAMEGISPPWTGPVVQDLDSPRTLYVSAGASRYRKMQLFRSTDFGDTWTAIGPAFDHDIGPIAQDSTASDTLWLAAGGQLWRSLDGGDQWQVAGDPPCNGGLSPAPIIDGGSILAGCVEDSGLPVSPPVYVSFLLRSDDGGETWQEILDGPSGSLIGTWTFSRDIANDRWFAFLAGSFTGGAYRSDDGGHSWSEIEGLDGRSMGAMLADSSRGEIFAGTLDQGVLRSTDDGATWHPYDQGLASARIYAFQLDARDASRLWAGTGAGAHRVQRSTPGTCQPSATSLCLLERFRADITWRDFDGNTGVGTASPLTSSTGTFWFFGEGNTELAVKVLDGRGYNGSYWVFFAGLSTVSYTLTVTDVVTGAQRTFENPAGVLQSGADISAFPAAGPGAAAPGDGAFVAGQVATAGEKAPLLLMDGRFAVEVVWRLPDGTSGAASGEPVSSESGILWFFEPSNVELFVKILDGRLFNGHHWLFFGALSNLGFDLTVTDLETGATRTYTNEAGSFASQVDTELF